MQEEVENRTVNLAISTTKLTGRTIIAGIRKYLQHREKVKMKKARDPAVHGKQSVKQLLGQNQGATNVEIDKESIRDFEKLAKKYGVDFAVRKDINTVFKGTLENLYLIISDSSFSKCTMHDLKISGYEEQSEITDCTFEECTFSDINLLADLTLQGGTVTNCTGNNLECIMNMIFAVQFTKSKFENINLNVAIIKNTFQQVEVSNIQNIDIGGEPVRKNNTFKDCYINGELQNQ